MPFIVWLSADLNGMKHDALHASFFSNYYSDLNVLNEDTESVLIQLNHNDIGPS